MRLNACLCGAEHLQRVPRSWWMRLFTWRRHYRCSRCGARMFIAKVFPVRRAGPIATP
jgi:DNA-directed RNA polymerase subunit RPC12/RpoP